MSRFIIEAPPWHHLSAGVQVMHKLCYMLTKAGYDAYMTNPSNPALGNKAWDGVMNDDDYVIYPDCTIGNPLNGKHVIRYMLYYSWKYFQNNRILKNEMCVPYAKYILPNMNQCTDYEVTEQDILEIGIVEPHLFYRNKRINKRISDWIIYILSSKM